LKGKMKKPDGGLYFERKNNEEAGRWADAPKQNEERRTVEVPLGRQDYDDKNKFPRTTPMKRRNFKKRMTSIPWHGYLQLV